MKIEKNTTRLFSYQFMCSDDGGKTWSKLAGYAASPNPSSIPQLEYSDRLWREQYNKPGRIFRWDTTVETSSTYQDILPLGFIPVIS